MKEKSYVYIPTPSFLFVACLLFISLASCRRNFISGYGKVVSEHRQIDSFNAVVVDAPVNVIIKVIAGFEPSLEIKGYKNLLDHIRTTVKNQKLTIAVTDGVIINTDENINIELTVSDLSKLDVGSTANTEVEGHVNNHSFSLKVADAGDVLFNNLTTRQLNVRISGAGKLAIQNGIVQHAVYKLSEAGNIKAYGLISNQAEINVSGASNIRLNTTNTLHATVTGAGNVSYKGHPQVYSAISGAGILRDAN